MKRILATLAPACALVTVLAAQPPDARRPGDGTGSHVNVAFPGGTLEQCVAAIRKAAGGVSVLLSQAVRGYQVPSLEVSSNDIEPVLHAVALVVRPKVVVHATGDRVFALTEPGGPEAPPETQVTILKVKDMVPGEEVAPELVAIYAQNVLSAIAQGLGMDGALTDGTLRYHRETGLIFVRGTEQQGAKAREIFNMADFDQKQLERQRQKEDDQRNRRDK